MKRNNLIFTVLILGMLFIPATLFISPVIVQAEDAAEPVPMDPDETTWDVEMIYVDSKGKKIASDDVLLFKDKQFISKEFENNDYTPTNYSLTLQEDGTTRFGTMQLKGKETAFWKGTIKDNAIRGSVHVQSSSGSKKTTYYTGTLTDGKLLPKGEKKKVAPPPPPPKPVAQEAPVEDVEQAAGSVADGSAKAQQADEAVAQ